MFDTIHYEESLFLLELLNRNEAIVINDRFEIEKYSKKYLKSFLKKELVISLK